EVLEKRALMLPQELKAMGPEKQVILYEGLAHPVLCRKIRYYKDGYFTRRLMPKVPIQPLELPGDKPVKGKTAAIVAASTLALLSACATPQAQETMRVPTRVDRKPELIPPVSPEDAAQIATAQTKVAELQTRLLALIDSLDSINDLSLTRVEQIMGIDMHPAEAHGNYRFRNELAFGWISFLDLTSSRKRPSLMLDFINRDRYAPMTAACLDFDNISEQLTTRGYDRQPDYASHEELLGWDFYNKRKEIVVRTSLQRHEFMDDRGNRSGRPCIERLWIN
ncbi:type IV secretory system conjugative DNA transfer family protein, partial [Luteimonas aestuarii]